MGACGCDYITDTGNNPNPMRSEDVARVLQR